MWGKARRRVQPFLNPLFNPQYKSHQHQSNQVIHNFIHNTTKHTIIKLSQLHTQLKVFRQASSHARFAEENILKDINYHYTIKNRSQRKIEP